MCSRYKLTTPTSVIVEDFGIRSGRPNLEPRYNIAPTQTAPIVRATPSGRQIAMVRWGLIPAWARDSKMAASTINARAETVAEKPTFRDAFRQRRCLVPADGFYEWKSEAGGKQPYMFRRADGGVMAFAGLWERWEKEDDVIESFTIIVTSANALVTDIHDRMPVILAPAQFELWLSGNTAEAGALLQPFDAAQMSVERVSRQLNKVAAEGPQLMTPEPAQPLLL